MSTSLYSALRVPLLVLASFSALALAGCGGGSDGPSSRFVQVLNLNPNFPSTEIGIRKSGIVRIDSACSPSDFLKDPTGNMKLLVETFQEAANIAEGYGERLAAEGEICWGGMQSWKANVELMERVGRPHALGFQADMAHTMLFTMGYNAPEARLLPPDFEWSQDEVLAAAYKKMASALRPWTVDFHVAQNDGTVKGEGSHDKTGKHCQPNDPNGKLNIVRDSGAWLRDDSGHVTRAFQHICWDGCMFPNDVMLNQQTWNDVLAVMIAVRNAHGWEHAHE